MKKQFVNRVTFDAWANEVQEASRLKHPNIVRTCGFLAIPGVQSTLKMVHGGVLTNRICMAIMMEPCVRTLQDEMPEIWSLSPQLRLVRACRVIVEVLGGLAALEEANMQHRDIKPNNVLEGRDGRYKIGDFGFARQSPEDGTVSLVVGTFGYVPPEGPGLKQDVFAAGVMFLEMLVKRKMGETVFFRRTILSMFSKAEIQVGIDTTAQLEKAVNLCHGMLRRYSHERFTAKRALSDTKKLLRLLEPHLYTR